MKKIIIVSIILGVVFSFIILFNYEKNSKNDDDIAINSQVHFLQVGAYKNYKNVTNITKTLPNYLVIEEDSLYHVYVGISKNSQNIEKIKVFYKESVNNIYVRTKSINCEEFLKDLDTYDHLLSSVKDKNSALLVNKQILNSYDEKCIKSGIKKE